MKQPVILPIGSMDRGDSFFVPCINEAEIRREAERLAKQFNVTLRVEKVVCDGMYGLRFWRL